MEIRKMTVSDDRAAVSRVYVESWRAAYRGIVPDDYLEQLEDSRWASVLDTPGLTSLLLVDGDRIVGTAAVCASRWTDFPACGEIVSLYLLPDYIGKGYGAALLQAAMAALQEAGFSDILLWVLEENLRAIRFYERLGFTDSGIRHSNVIGGKSVSERLYLYHDATEGG